MPERDDENFLLRWSRRKREAGPGKEAPGPELGPAPGADGAGFTREGPVDATEDIAEAGAAPGDPAAGDEAAAAAETVPDDLVGVEVEALDYDADFTRFMQNDVPEALRKRALRQLWRSDPILANVDGLNDYDDDFTDAALAVKVLETAHKIGRGYLDDDDDDVGQDEDVVAGEDDSAETPAVRAEHQDEALDPNASEVDAEAPDRDDDEVVARVDGSGPGVEGEGEDEVTRTG
jgi:hypothetical protein